MTNIDDVDIWESRYPGLGVLGINGFDFSGYYFEVKSPPDDVVELEELKQKLLPCYDTPGHRCYDEFRNAYSRRPKAVEIIVVPVEYSYYDLARWAEILNRFAVSSGNTISLLGTRIGTNYEGYEVTLYPLIDLQKAESGDGGKIYSAVRTTIHVWADDAQRVAAALPDLLAQLGIPVDAVGVIGQSNARRGGPEIALDGSSSIFADKILGGDSSSGDSTGWILTAMAGGLAGVLLIAASFVTIRVRRTAAGLCPRKPI